MSDDGKLTGHSALIAGAAGGIGLATALLLAAEDCQLHLSDLNDSDLEAAADNITDSCDVEVDIYSTDLSESINAAALGLECEDVSILVNAFGNAPAGNIDTLQADDWKEGFETRVFGAINLTREVLESMNELGSGIIINVGCTVEGDEPDQLCLHSANASLETFSKILDNQYKRQGIRVLTFLPTANASTSDNAADLVKLIYKKLSS
jgi:short-subunit dehydrogenase